MSLRAFPACSRESSFRPARATASTAKILAFPGQRVENVEVVFIPAPGLAQQSSRLIRGIGIALAFETVVASCFYLVLHHFHILR
jgi:hypothetical protein